MNITDKETYRTIYADYDIPIQFSPDWMDAVCVKGNWDVIVERNGKGKLLGVLVYHIRKKYGLSLIVMPPMTAYNGIYLLYPENLSNYNKGHFTYKTTEALISKLPKLSMYYQQYHTSYNNWLALYWNGYKETTRYTYLVDTSPGKEALWPNLKRAVQKDIENADNICDLIEIDMSSYLTESSKAYSERGKPFPSHKESLSRLYDNLKDKGQIQIFAAKHKDTKEILSAQILVYDKKRTYAVACFYKKKENIRTTLSYVIWNCFFVRDNGSFDFEGSLIRGVERYVRSFDAVITPHYRIHKVNNPVLRLALNVAKQDFFA